MTVVRAWALTLMVFALAVAGCRGGSLVTETPAIFLPPTLAATPTPQPLPTTTLPPAPPTPPCVDNLVFLEDITIPDGTHVPPGAILDKRWRIQNAGTCNWDSRYQVRLIAGTAMNAPQAQALFPARSGTEVELQIQFNAPEEPGDYRSAWQAYDPQGNPFGDPFFIEVVVDTAETP